MRKVASPEATLRTPRKPRGAPKTGKPQTRKTQPPHPARTSRQDDPMAIAYARVQSINRAAGKNAVALAAYVTRERLTDESIGATFDYRRRQKDSPAIVLPTTFPPGENPVEREALWNMAEAAEKRKDSTTGRGMIGALPNELDADAQARICQSVADHLAREHGVAVDVAIHRDEGNNHAHILWTSRRFAGGELRDKTREFDLRGTASKSLLAIRKVWEDASNRELESAGFQERIDMRSYQAQGLDLEGQIHLGRAAIEHQADTGESDRFAQNEARKERDRVRLDLTDAGREFRQGVTAFKRAKEFADTAREAAEKASAEAEEAARREAENLRGREILAALAGFVAGEKPFPEILGTLRAFQSADSLANLNLADAGGNKFAHMVSAAQHAIKRQEGGDPQVRDKQMGDLAMEVRAVAVAWQDAGNRLDKKSLNANGQTPDDVRKNGLAGTAPPAKAGGPPSTLPELERMGRHSIFLIPDEEKRDIRGRALLGEFSNFFAGNMPPAEFVATLANFSSPETAANLLMADAHGNKFAHLSAAIQNVLDRRRKEKGEGSAGEGETGRHMVRELANVARAWMAASGGAGFDTLSKNIHGQTPDDIRRDGLATAPPVVQRVGLAKPAGRVVMPRANPVQPIRQKRPKKPLRPGQKISRMPGQAIRLDPTVTGSPVATIPAFITLPGIATDSGKSIAEKLAARPARQQGRMLPGQWLIPPDATPEQIRVIEAHNRDIANAQQSKYSRTQPEK